MILVAGIKNKASFMDSFGSCRIIGALMELRASGIPAAGLQLSCGTGSRRILPEPAGDHGDRLRRFFGKGLGYGTQARLGFLPEYQTDFIFGAIAKSGAFGNFCFAFRMGADFREAL